MNIIFLLIFVLIGCNSLFATGKTVYIKLDWSFGYWPKKELDAAFAKRGYTVKEVRTLANLTDVAYIITYDVPMRELGYLRSYSPAQCILVMWEPPVIKGYNFDKQYHNLYSKVLTWHDDLVDNKKYFKCNYTVWQPLKEDPVPFAQKKLCTLIATNKDSTHPATLFNERLALVRSFTAQTPTSFDLFGGGWDQNVFATYRGRVGDKFEALQKYKFCLCFENTRINGYISEKVFDAFIAGCVPIYKGPANAGEWIPANCFINPDDFPNHAALIKYLQEMPQEVYEMYRTHIRNFMLSDAAKQFSNEQYAQIMMHAIFGK